MHQIWEFGGWNSLQWQQTAHQHHSARFWHSPFHKLVWKNTLVCCRNSGFIEIWKGSPGFCLFSAGRSLWKKRNWFALKRCVLGWRQWGAKLSMVPLALYIPSLDEKRCSNCPAKTFVVSNWALTVRRASSSPWWQPQKFAEAQWIGQYRFEGERLSKRYGSGFVWSVLCALVWASKTELRIFIHCDRREGAGFLVKLLCWHRRASVNICKCPLTISLTGGGSLFGQKSPI